jgi:hypothetical protein
MEESVVNPLLLLVKPIARHQIVCYKNAIRTVWQNGKSSQMAGIDSIVPFKYQFRAIS